jgi:putative ABC transport system substrate-binding protein
LVAELEWLRPAFHRLRLTIHELGIRNLEDIRTVLKALEREHLQALLILDSATTELHSGEIMRSVAQRLPVVSEGREWAERGALLTYAPDYLAMWKRAAAYVDKILKGAKPADLPIEQPTKFLFIVNARAAKTLRIAVPQTILLQADEVIQ